jgi:biopolymer transport protein ExbD/biopolymer transport protein TolR
MAAGARRTKTFSDINITPLTDVFLVLLVVIIIAAPALSNIQKGISTPQVHKAITLKNTWLVAEVDKTGAVFIDGVPVQEAQVRDVLAAKLPSLEEKILVVRGDEIAKSGVVLSVMRAAKEAGFEQGFIAGQITRLPATPLR